MTEPNESELEPKRARALAMFLEGAEVGEVARETGVSRTTLWRWRDDPTFAYELAVARKKGLETARDELRASALDAVAALRAILCDESQPAGVRLRAIELTLARSGLDDLEPPSTPRASPVADMTLPEQKAYILRCLAHVNSKLGIRDDE